MAGLVVFIDLLSQVTVSPPPPFSTVVWEDITVVCPPLCRFPAAVGVLSSLGSPPYAPSLLPGVCIAYASHEAALPWVA